MNHFPDPRVCVVVLWAGNKVLDSLSKSLIAATTQKNPNLSLALS